MSTNAVGPIKENAAGPNLPALGLKSPMEVISILGALEVKGETITTQLDPNKKVQAIMDYFKDNFGLSPAQLPHLASVIKNGLKNGGLKLEDDRAAINVTKEALNNYVSIAQRMGNPHRPIMEAEVRKVSGEKVTAPAVPAIKTQELNLSQSVKIDAEAYRPSIEQKGNSLTVLYLLSQGNPQVRNLVKQAIEEAKLLANGATVNA